MKTGDRIGIICCSNGQKRSSMEKIKYLETALQEIGISASFSGCIYEKEDVFSGTPRNGQRRLCSFTWMMK